MKRFQAAAEGLEKGEVSIDEAFARGEEAATAWGKLTVEAQDREYASRDAMEKSIVEFRPLAVRTFVITSVLMGLCILAFGVAAYATARALQAERRRFDRFELLLATVGHDLRSPLQALVGAAKLAAADALPTERDKFVRIVHERSAFFTRLLDDLVNLARSESLSFVATPLDLSTWFEAAASRYRQAVEAKHLTFSASLAAPVPRIVFDPHRLTQCADNLVFNAVRYTKEGSVSFVVRCEPAAGAESKLTIEVTDTGRGIAAADQARIFKPFVRVDSSVKGMGVGLSMVASLARRVGGSVGVRSTLGQGSTFTFTAPVAADDSPASSVAEAGARENVARGGSASRAVVPRVLVVDDDEHITQVVGGLLPHMGFAADVAIGGQAGLALAKQHSYCAVLTDIQMPDLDGFELAESLRASLDPCPMLIAMTAYTTKPAADQRSRVFDAMLRKPFDEDELGELLDQAATRWAAMSS
jgi:signal transduction histidine kinase/ActR/RegA family two-component response regulator